MLIIYPANYEAYRGESEAPVNLQEVPKDMKVTGRANPGANGPALSTGRYPRRTGGLKGGSVLEELTDS